MDLQQLQAKAAAAANSKPSSSKSAKVSTSKGNSKGTKAGVVDSRSRDDHDHELANGVRQIYL